MQAPQATRRPTLHLDRDGPSARGDQVVDLGRAALLRPQPAVDLIAKKLLLPYSASAGMPERRCIRPTSTRNALKRLWLPETASGWPPASTAGHRQRHRQPPSPLSSTRRLRATSRSFAGPRKTCRYGVSVCNTEFGLYRASSSSAFPAADGSLCGPRPTSSCSPSARASFAMVFSVKLAWPPSTRVM